MTPSRFVSSSRRLWSCISQFLVRPAINFDAVELLVCSRDDWKKNSGSEYYRVSGLLRNYQQPIINQIKQETRVLFLSDPGIASSLLAKQLASALTEAAHPVKTLSLKRPKRLKSTRNKTRCPRAITASRQCRMPYNSSIIGEPSNCPMHA